MMDPDPGGPKTYGFYVSGSSSTTLVTGVRNYRYQKDCNWFFVKSSNVKIFCRKSTIRRFYPLFLCGVSMIKTVSVNILKYFLFFFRGSGTAGADASLCRRGRESQLGTHRYQQFSLIKVWYRYRNCQCSGSGAAGSVLSKTRKSSEKDTVMTCYFL
jgi:hypothetical protein